MTTPVSIAPRSIAQVGELLGAEFRTVLPAAVVSEVVRGARRDLDGQTPPTALPEMVFRLARVRLGEFIYSISY